MTKANTLSLREQEVLQLAAKGLTNREIAQSLSISPNTVKVHLRNIFEKAGVASRTEAALYGMEHGIVTVPGVTDDVMVERFSVFKTMNKFRWVWVAMVLLLVAFGVTFTANVLLPAPTLEIPAFLDTAERWKQLAPMPEYRVGMAIIAYDGDIYALAGEGRDGVAQEVFRYLPNEDRWEKLSEKPTPVTDAQGVLIGERIYIPGGRLANSTPTDILEIYDPREDSWENGANLPKAISAYALADFEGKLYLFGGWDGKDVLADVYVYDPGEDVWDEGTRMAIPREEAGAVVLADKIVLLGGRNDGGALKDVKAYFPSRDYNSEDPWDIFPELPESLFDFGVVSISDRILIIGGKTLENSKSEEIAIYQFDNDRWSLLESETDFINPQLSLEQIGSQIYLLFTDDEGVRTRLWRYTAFYYEIFVPFVQ